MNSGAKPSQAPKGSRQDKALVEECLLGSEEAWSELIDKYKNLIFSIPIKYGLSYDDAAEIFQSVSFALLRDLAGLREPQALPAWLIKMTARKCVRLKREKQVYSETKAEEDRMVETGDLPDKLLQDLERENILRETLSEMSPECRRLIDLLFFADPPMRYEEAAQALGLAKGSMGATRMRCLEKLRHFLEKRGFR